VRDPDVLERHRVEAHHLGGDRVDGNLIGARQHVVLHDGDHRPRPGAVARGRPVHHGEEARVDLFLDGEQVDQRLVDPRMGVVPLGGEQAPERVLHGAGRRRSDERTTALAARLTGLRRSARPQNS